MAAMQRVLPFSWKYRWWGDCVLQLVIGGRRKLLPVKNPWLLSALVGRHINVVTLQRTQGIRLKVTSDPHPADLCVP